MAFNQPLDLGMVFVKHLAGNADVFILIGIAMIAILAARWKMSVGLMLGFIGFFVALMYYSGTSPHFDMGGATLGLMILICIIASVAIAVTISKFQR